MTNFSLLTQVQSTNQGFFFVALKPWEVRKSKEEQLDYISASLGKQLAGNADGIAFRISSAIDPRHRNVGRRDHGD